MTNLKTNVPSSIIDKQLRRPSRGSISKKSSAIPSDGLSNLNIATFPKSPVTSNLIGPFSPGQAPSHGGTKVMPFEKIEEEKSSKIMEPNMSPIMLNDIPDVSET